MLLLRAPGVYRPQYDTELLARTLAQFPGLPDARVLDICTGTGAVAISAARAGALSVTAVDISRRALMSARLNSRVHRAGIELLHGDFARVLRGRRFDLVVSNPPYVPCPGPWPPRGRARSWDAGTDGRAVLDVLCDLAPDLLSAGGTLLTVNSTLSDPDATLDRLRQGGLAADVVARERIPFGPVLRARYRWMTAAGLIRPGQTTEELVVVRADRPRRHSAVTTGRTAI